MADIVLTLNPVVSRRKLPYRIIEGVMAGSETIRIIAGKYLDVPNIWSLQEFWVSLTTDVTVANRYVKLFEVIDGVDANYLTGSVVVASETKKIVGTQESGLSGMTKLSADGYCTLTENSMLFGGDDSLYLDVVSGVAGDSVSYFFKLLWRNWDLGMMQPRKIKE